MDNFLTSLAIFNFDFEWNENNNYYLETENIAIGWL